MSLPLTKVIRFDRPISWNSNRFIAHRNGEVVARYDSKIGPQDPQLVEKLEQVIVELLDKRCQKRPQNVPMPSWIYLILYGILSSMCRSLVFALIFAFFLNVIAPIPQAQAQPLLGLPEPGAMLTLSQAFAPPIIRGLTVHKDNPFLFDFIVDPGQDQLSGPALQTEGEKLIKYFLASLALPEKDLWVNLSPYEQNRTIPEALGQTDLGRDLLAQDYILKQLTASLIYPEKELGKKFWDKIYSQAQSLAGSSQVSLSGTAALPPVNTFNKVWIVADKAEVFERNQTVFVIGSHLKVMLEEDYWAAQKQGSPAEKTQAAKILRDVIVPAIEHEVNTGKHFAPLRQIFNSIILAGWYKKNLKAALLNQVYTDQSKIKGIALTDASIKKQIYERYLQAYKKGVFNYIKEGPPAAGKDARTPRKYFSGGITGQIQEYLPATQAVFYSTLPRDRAMSVLKTQLNDPGISPLMSPLAADYVGGPNAEILEAKILKKVKELNRQPSSVFMVFSDVPIPATDEDLQAISARARKILAEHHLGSMRAEFRRMPRFPGAVPAPTSAKPPAPQANAAPNGLDFIGMEAEAMRKPDRAFRLTSRESKAIDKLVSRQFNDENLREAIRDMLESRIDKNSPIDLGDDDGQRIEFPEQNRIILINSIKIYMRSKPGQRGQHQPVVTMQDVLDIIDQQAEHLKKYHIRKYSRNQWDKVIKEAKEMFREELGSSKAMVAVTREDKKKLIQGMEVKKLAKGNGTHTPPRKRIKTPISIVMEDQSLEQGQIYLVPSANGKEGVLWVQFEGETLRLLDIEQLGLTDIYIYGAVVIIHSQSAGTVGFSKLIFTGPEPYLHSIAGDDLIEVLEINRLAPIDGDMLEHGVINRSYTLSTDKNTVSMRYSTVVASLEKLMGKLAGLSTSEPAFKMPEDLYTILELRESDVTMERVGNVVQLRLLPELSDQQWTTIELKLQAIHDVFGLNTKIDKTKREISVEATISPAMTAVDGGIDLQAATAKTVVQKQGSGVDMAIDPAMLERVRAQGLETLVPKVLSIVPLTPAQIGALVGPVAPHFS